MLGASPPPQNEETPFYPRSPYGVAKLYSYWITKNYREAYGMFAVNGVLFNHESPRRGETFVTRKITRAVARIKAGLEDSLYMGNLDAVRDWGYAPEYVEGIWRMLQADEPDDFVLSTGTGYTVRDFLQFAFSHADLDWQDHVRFDERYLRPSEVDALIGDSSKAQRILGWTPSVHAKELAAIMVEADVAALECEGKPWIDKPAVAGWQRVVRHRTTERTVLVESAKTSAALRDTDRKADSGVLGQRHSKKCVSDPTVVAMRRTADRRETSGELRSGPGVG
jgi:GDPmannose 4,6-dehydratase